MCGIAGIVATDPTYRPHRDVVQHMTAVLSHRGPDADGYYLAPGVALGHRRLSIIDLSSGNQPIHNEDGTRSVVFNGEIYNFRELRTQLVAQGHRFSTESDTEVIVHAWEQYGDECINHLRGMFALALWDQKDRRLLLARDRVGKKPLYYVHTPEHLLFGSEIKALLAHPSVKRAISLEALDDYLAFGAVPAPRTIFREIEQIPPGHYLIWENGRVRLREYWDLAFSPDEARSEQASLEEFHDIFSEAVRLRMVSDVPVGAFLSGGVDSSGVVAAMAVQSNQPVATTTVVFRESSFTEARYARAVADALGTDHHEVTVQPDAATVLPRLVWHLDEPFADSSALPTYYLSQAARQRVTVALSGDGGDEVFAGYGWRYGLTLFEHRVRRRLPLWCRQHLLSPVASIWPKGDRLPRPLRWKHFMRNVSLEPERAYFHDMSLFTPTDKLGLLTEEFRRSLNGHDPFLAYSRHFERVRELDPLSRVLYVDVKTYLPNDILVKLDRMAMANSLEVRSPLLDEKVIAFAATLPLRLKFSGTTSKYLLKRYVAQRVPAFVVHRPKMGFSIPLAQWLRGSLRESARELLLSDRTLARHYFVSGQLHNIWSAHQAGHRDHSHRLWALMVLELWHRLFVDRV